MGVRWAVLWVCNGQGTLAPLQQSGSAPKHRSGAQAGVMQYLRRSSGKPALALATSLLTWAISPASLLPQALAAARKGGRSGDADLPSREPLHERRAKFDSVRARQQVRTAACACCCAHCPPSCCGPGSTHRASGCLMTCPWGACHLAVYGPWR